MALYTVIGAGGFIGSRLADSLRADGHEVFAPPRDEAGLFERDCGRVLYCAGLTADYRTRPFDTVEAHVALLSRFLQRGRYERIVYLSSARLYQTSRAAHGREDEPLPLNPSDPEQVYDLSKALGENLAVHRSEGRGAAARLSYVFDWTEDAAGFLSDWLKAARGARELEVPSTPRDGRDYIHRDDVIAALRALADTDLNAIVNVASGRTTTNTEIALAFERAGWRVAFSGAGEPAAPTALDTGRLRGLGVTPRPPLELISGYLEGL